MAKLSRNRRSQVANDLFVCLFYSLIKSYDSLNNKTIPTREQCIDDMKGEMMS